jgi:hypothetical protein
MKQGLWLLVCLLVCSIGTSAQVDEWTDDCAHRTRLDSMQLMLKEISEGWRVFRSDELGASFRINSEWVHPTDHNPKRPVTQDQQKWKTYSSERFGIEFQYPPELDVRIDTREFRNAEDCDSSLAICLGAEERSEGKPTGEFFDMVTIFFSHRTFAEIADDEGFEFAEKFDPADSLYEHPKVDSTHWDIMGREGMRESASPVLGKNWRGLRGDNVTGVYHKEEGYAGLGDFSAAFLIFERTGRCSAVFTFYCGPTLYLEDEVNVELDETTFYRIVSTAKLNR